MNVLIERDPGQQKINQLRIIHLFKADFNLFLKLQWGSRLIEQATKLSLLNYGQHGSRPNWNAKDPVLLTQLTTNLSRTMKTNLAHFDNDTSTCYNQIIVMLGMMAAHRCGMPTNAVSTHAEALQLMKYAVKTVHDISEENYHGTPFESLFGTGQQNRASPPVWLTLMVILTNTIRKIVPKQIQF